MKVEMQALTLISAARAGRCHVHEWTREGINMSKDGQPPASWFHVLLCSTRRPRL